MAYMDGDNAKDTAGKLAVAMDAVAQWIFEPTLLNGQPVEVSAPITVNFILK